VLAFAAGVLSFTSPCCLPLMPGYISTTETATVDSAALRRGRALPAALLVFTALGAGASAVGEIMLTNRPLLSRIGGIVIITMGLVLAGVIRIPGLMREYRFDLSKIRPGPTGAVPLGIAFAIGWVPCIGPVLAGILTLAASGASVASGATLLAIYSLGLGLPFVALAVAASRLEPVVRWLRRHARAVELSGAAVLVGMGALLVTDRWLQFFAPLMRMFARLGWPPI
jgi:cytochrome c-type biogenesis protein